MTTKIARAKKVTAQSKRTKAAKRVLARADGPQCFWVNEGPILSSLLDLKDALQKMSSAMYAHHVGESRNDFADWIEYVLGDVDLAAELRPLRTPKQARTVVIRRLKIYDLS
jgi:hypothetical protein